MVSGQSGSGGSASRTQSPTRTSSTLAVGGRPASRVVRAAGPLASSGRLPSIEPPRSVPLSSSVTDLARAGGWVGAGSARPPSTAGRTGLTLLPRSPELTPASAGSMRGDLHSRRGRLARIRVPQVSKGAGAGAAPQGSFGGEVAPRGSPGGTRSDASARGTSNDIGGAGQGGNDPRAVGARPSDPAVAGRPPAGFGSGIRISTGLDAWRQAEEGEKGGGEEEGGEGETPATPPTPGRAGESAGVPAPPPSLALVLAPVPAPQALERPSSPTARLSALLARAAAHLPGATGRGGPGDRTPGPHVEAGTGAREASPPGALALAPASGRAGSAEDGSRRAQPGTPRGERPGAVALAGEAAGAAERRGRATEPQSVPAGSAAAGLATAAPPASASSRPALSHPALSLLTRPIAFLTRPSAEKLAAAAARADARRRSREARGRRERAERERSEAVGRACEALGVTDAQSLEDVLSAAVLAEAVYGAGDDPAARLARAVGLAAARLPPGSVRLTTIQPALGHVEHRYLLAESPTTLYVACVGTSRARDMVTNVDIGHTALGEIFSDLTGAARVAAEEAAAGGAAPDAPVVGEMGEDLVPTSGRGGPGRAGDSPTASGSSSAPRLLSNLGLAGLAGWGAGAGAGAGARGGGDDLGRRGGEAGREGAPGPASPPLAPASSPVLEPPAPRPAPTAGPADSPGDPDPAPHPSLVPAAHRGFVRRSRAVPADALFQRARARNLRLVLCGHSLGGAVAGLAALEVLRGLRPEENPTPSLLGWLPTPFRRSLSPSRPARDPRAPPPGPASDDPPATARGVAPRHPDVSPPPPLVSAVCFAAPGVANEALRRAALQAGWDKVIRNYVVPEDPVPRMLSWRGERRPEAARERPHWRPVDSGAGEGAGPGPGPGDPARAGNPEEQFQPPSPRSARRLFATAAGRLAQALTAVPGRAGQAARAVALPLAWAVNAPLRAAPAFLPLGRQLYLLPDLAVSEEDWKAGRARGADAGDQAAVPAPSPLTSAPGPAAEPLAVEHAGPVGPTAAGLAAPPNTAPASPPLPRAASLKSITLGALRAWRRPREAAVEADGRPDGPASEGGTRTRPEGAGASTAGAAPGTGPGVRGGEAATARGKGQPGGAPAGRPSEMTEDESEVAAALALVPDAPDPRSFLAAHRMATYRSRVASIVERHLRKGGEPVDPAGGGGSEVAPGSAPFASMSSGTRAAAFHRLHPSSLPGPLAPVATTDLAPPLIALRARGRLMLGNEGAAEMPWGVAGLGDDGRGDGSGRDDLGSGARAGTPTVAAGTGPARPAAEGGAGPTGAAPSRSSSAPPTPRLVLRVEGRGLASITALRVEGLAGTPRGIPLDIVQAATSSPLLRAQRDRARDEGKEASEGGSEARDAGGWGSYAWRWVSWGMGTSSGDAQDATDGSGGEGGAAPASAAAGGGAPNGRLARAASAPGAPARGAPAAGGWPDPRPSARTPLASLRRAFSTLTSYARGEGASPPVVPPSPPPPPPPPPEYLIASAALPASVADGKRRHGAGPAAPLIVVLQSDFVERRLPLEDGGGLDALAPPAPRSRL